MVGGSGGTNNVSVNISMDNQGGSQEQNTSDNSQMKQLGLVISGAVQEELQRQKRPGGILSPYGAA
jgi:phage-related minor tail protein